MTANPYGSDSGDGLDTGRGSACTPEWLCTLLGDFDLDPCWNPRAHVRARHTCDGTPGDPTQDGLWIARYTPSDWRVFLNPGYGRGVVIQWVRAYVHTDFVFLLRFDPSTDWFAALAEVARYVWLPHERVNFDAPPEVAACEACGGTGKRPSPKTGRPVKCKVCAFAANPYPHACFMRSGPNPEMRAAGYTFKVA